LKYNPPYKVLVAFLLLVAFFGQTFSKSLLVADYFAHTAAYAKNCENKANPAMKCHGKCQMNKALGKQQKQDQENPCKRAAFENELLLYSKSYFASVAVPAIQIIAENKVATWFPGHSTNGCLDIFHPPQLV
jgi:hypothetical protein